MVHVLYAHYKIRKSYFMMGSVCLDIRKGCVWMLHLYTCFNFRESYLRMVDIQDTHFIIGKGCVCLVDVLYKHFDIRKGFVMMVDVQYSHYKMRKSHFVVVDFCFDIWKAVRVDVRRSVHAF